MSDLNIFHGPNAGYVLELYERFLADPQSVDADTRAFFERWAAGDGVALGQPAAQPASEVALSAAAEAPRAALQPIASDTTLDVAHIVGAARLIRYIRELGHLDAQIDPLGSAPPGDPGTTMVVHNVNEQDLMALPASLVRGPLVESSANALEAIEKLRRAYSGPIGYETDHVQNFRERAWIRDAIESGRYWHSADDDRRRDLLERLTQVEVFERFLHQTLAGQKRFSIEGCDMLVPMLDTIIRNAATSGTREVVLGMAHRGRLNVLAHVLGKPYAAILSEFHAAHHDEGSSPSGKGSIGWTGDVKYHLGARREYREAGIEQMPLTLAPNPSHLEFVDPVVEGRARAAQEHRDQPGAPQQDAKASLAILMHGDAAFPGQGIVPETLNLSGLAGYNTGGTIHIITNNQIGFTTEPTESRSTLYASDLAKGFEIPIVHVNADDPEACIAVAYMAHDYREIFGKDFLIDLVGYRRWGHNEGDEPAFTQPQMYQRITQHPTVRALLAERLEQEGLLKPGDADLLVKRIWDQLQQTWGEVQQHPKATNNSARSQPNGLAREIDTAVSAEQLRELNRALLDRPAGFTPHTRLERTLQRRAVTIDQERGIDWAHAEALAFATILADGVPIRLTGQDSERGTFSQRHLVLHHAETGQRYVPHQSLPQAQASFAVYNSPLSENATLGFEYGYSTHAPGVLVLWEGQFGDFANGAQVIIDQFMVSGRAKWGQLPALVLLLPHGYEGQGPEHSSARLERYLQLAADDNLRIANCTTAAQYFHLLRRQAALLTRDPRPLVVMTPKSLLRQPRASSSLADLAEQRFQPVLDDPTARNHARQVTRLILCSGKVAIDAQAALEAEPLEHVALVRIEELYPFPTEELQTVLAGYPKLREVVWMQEEPYNMGGWSYMWPRLCEVLGPELALGYAGRPEYATPAEGSLAEHQLTQARLVRQALQEEIGALPTLPRLLGVGVKG